MLHFQNFWNEDVGLTMILGPISPIQVLVKVSNTWMNQHIYTYQQADDFADNENLFKLLL